MRRKTAAMLGVALMTLSACQPKPPESAATAGSAEEPKASVPVVPPPPPAFRGAFNARGTEPFWAARIRADGITIMRADTPPVVGTNSGPHMAGPQAVWAAKVGEEPLVVALLEHQCSDGATDRVYDYAVEVQIGEDSLSGCAERADQAEQ